MSIFNFHEDVQDIETWWTTKIEPYLKKEAAGAGALLKKFISQFDTQFGQQALTASIEAVGSIAAGAQFAPTAIGLATTLYNDAKADVKADATLDAAQVLQTVQSALQVAKAANGIVTTADATAAAQIASPVG